MNAITKNDLVLLLVRCRPQPATSMMTYRAEYARNFGEWLGDGLLCYQQEDRRGNAFDPIADLIGTNPAHLHFVHDLAEVYAALTREPDPIPSSFAFDTEEPAIDLGQAFSRGAITAFERISTPASDFWHSDVRVGALADLLTLCVQFAGASAEVCALRAHELCSMREARGDRSAGILYKALLCAGCGAHTGANESLAGLIDESALRTDLPVAVHSAALAFSKRMRRRPSVPPLSDPPGASRGIDRLTTGRYPYPALEAA